MKFLYDHPNSEIQAIVTGTEVSLTNINDAFRQFSGDFGNKVSRNKTSVRSHKDERYGTPIMVIATKIPRKSKVPGTYLRKKII